MEVKMALIVISVDREDLPPHTDEQFEEWVKYEVGHLGGISCDNPMSDRDLDAYVRNFE
jgi:hypothetical protein